MSEQHGLIEPTDWWQLLSFPVVVGSSSDIRMATAGYVEVSAEQLLCAEIAVNHRQGVPQTRVDLAKRMDSVPDLW